MLYPLLIILILLAIIVFQDFKTRSIHWITLPPLFLALYFFPLDIINQFDVLQNFFFLVLIFAFMSLYLRFRQNEWVNPTKDFFGWGDILFLIAITPATYFRNFMFLFIFGTIFSLLFSILDRKSTRLNSSHVRISYAVFCLKKKKKRIETS